MMREIVGRGIASFAISGVAGLGLMFAGAVTWRMGFEQGADVALCTVDAMQQRNEIKGGRIVITSAEPCKRAKAGEDGVFYQMNRKGRWF